MNPADSLNKIPENFTPECYEYYNKIDKSEVRNNATNEKYMTYKVNINKVTDLVVTQFGFILPYKFYSDFINNYSYENNLWLETDFLLDYNSKTFRKINSNTQNEIVLSFDETLEKNNFNFIFNFSVNNYSPEYYISFDENSWEKIKKSDITEFSFKYLKIKFVSKTEESFLENIKIYELNFPKKYNTILVKSFYNENIELYSKYNCKDKTFNTTAKKYDEFSVNNETKIIRVNSEKNPKYNVYFEKDYDNDWVSDEEDNCKYRYNPDQADKNGDGRWDMCSDDDKDWKQWYYDNCVYVYNPDQADVNRNNIWDECEFDKDKDTIFDWLDNCINDANPEQEDDDRDGIWNVCDNSIYYNPRQIDKNNNGIGDITEQKEKELKENDDDNDWIINYKDNCKKIANSDQEDSDKDWVWNRCDNCIDYQNADQLDFNKNWVWDICEDSDNDWIEWLTDNCINIANSNQSDTDNDWIWDLCEDDDHDNILAANDNCPYEYNPEQIDIDKDWKWDKCDKNDNRYIESNSAFFIWLLIFITLIFGGGIYMMVRKLK